MIEYRYLAPAERELNEAALFYEAATEGLGSDFLDDIQRTIDRLREKPQIGTSLAGNLRRAIVARFPFNVIYAVEGDRILVVAIAHQRRHPNYWHSRQRR